MLHIYYSIRADAVAIIRCAMLHLAIIVDANKFMHFVEKTEEWELSKRSYLGASERASERRRRLRGAKDERQNFLIGRP